VDWRTALAQTTENEPDTRFVAYDVYSGRMYTGQRRPGVRDAAVLEPRRVPDGLRGRLHRPLQDGAAVHGRLVRIAGQGEIRAGITRTGIALSKCVDFSTRRTRSARSPVRFLQPGARGDSGFRQRRPNPQVRGEDQGPRTRSTPAREIAAMYVMGDLPIVADQLRLVAGTRLEYSYIATDGFDIANNVPCAPG